MGSTGATSSASSVRSWSPSARSELTPSRAARRAGVGLPRRRHAKAGSLVKDKDMDSKDRNSGVAQLLRRAAGALALGAAFVAASPASAADVCISQSAKDALAVCPGGKL